VHLILDGKLQPKKTLDSLELVYQLLDELPPLLKMNKLIPPFVIRYDGGKKKEDSGITGIIIIAESHIAFHSFPLEMVFI